MDRWTFLTNHSHVLLSIAQDPEIRLRDVALRVGITERAAQRIVSDLVEGGYLTPIRMGRRNRYEIHPDLPFRHSVEGHSSIRALLEMFTGPLPRPHRALRAEAVPFPVRTAEVVPIS